MFRLMAICLLAMAGAAAAAAQHEKDITPTVFRELERSCTADERLRAAQHALANVAADNVMQNWERMTAVDTFFTLRLKDERITSQKETGRCWMFSGLNIIRPIVCRKLGCDDIELSQNYLFFFEKLEKANLFLEAMIETKDSAYTTRTVEFLLKQNVQDGQNWLGFTELVKKYGIVPKEAMPETYSSSNSSHVNKVLSLRLKQAAVRIRHQSDPDSIAGMKMQALKDVYRILAVNFGVPPATFSWRYMTTDKKLTPLKTYSPLQFYRETVGDALEEYYPLYSIPTLAFQKKYEIAFDRTVRDQPNMYFVNCPLEILKNLAKTSLLDSNAVWFGCEVGAQSSTKEGLMTSGLYDYQSFYGIDFSMTRDELFETYSSTPSHNMVFTGIDIVDGNVIKWLVENSWGDTAGKRGYFFMLDDWFDQYVQVVVVRKKYIPREILAIFDTSAETLPPWDPMWLQ